MTTPIRPNIRKRFKPMRNTMIQFLLIRVLNINKAGSVAVQVLRQIGGGTVSALVLLMHFVTTFP